MSFVARMCAWMRKTIFDAIARRSGITLYFSLPEKTAIVERIKAIKREQEVLLGDDEAYHLVSLLQSVAKIDGDIAEVGTYTGGSARLLGEYKKEKALHLFDTFEGLPAPGKNDFLGFKKRLYTTTIDSVTRSISGIENVTIYPGLFPWTAEPVATRRFSFVHLDVDLYEGTLAGLTFFYPRMNPGGIIITHDAVGTDLGAGRAFAEFFADKAEPILLLSRSQAAIMKIGEAR